MTAKQFTLTNTGTSSLVIQSVTFNGLSGIGHTANLVNLGGSSTETGNATLSYTLVSNAVQTFTVDYYDAGSGIGTYTGNIVIGCSNSVTQTIAATVVISPTTTTTTTSGPATTTTTTTSAPTTTTTTTTGPTTTTTTAAPAVRSAIFGFGRAGSSNTNIINIVSNTGIVAADVSTVATVRFRLAAAGYGTDKAIFGFGSADGGTTSTSITNLVSTSGVVATDTAGVGTSRYELAAATYGVDKAIFGFGAENVSGTTELSITNLVSNTGVVATDTSGVGTARSALAAAGYGGDKAIFGFGFTDFSNYYSLTNLVNNLGVVATDTSGVGTARSALAAAGYGTDKAIFGFGATLGGLVNITNLVSNTGVVIADQTALTGTPRSYLAAAGYGGDKAIFGFGDDGVSISAGVNVTNLVSNLGVVATDISGVGTARSGLAAASYGSGSSPTTTTTTAAPTTTTTTAAPTTTTTTAAPTTTTTTAAPTTTTTTTAAPTTSTTTAAPTSTTTTTAAPTSTTTTTAGSTTTTTTVAPPSLVFNSVDDFTITNSNVLANNATLQLVFTENGQITNSGDNVYSYAGPTAYLNPLTTGAGSGFEIKVTLTSGAVGLATFTIDSVNVTNGTTTPYYNLAGNIPIVYQLSDPSFVGLTSTAIGTVYIRNISTLTEISRAFSITCSTQ